MHRDSRQEHVKSFGRQGNIMSDNNWRAKVHDTHWNYLEVLKMMCDLKSSVSVELITAFFMLLFRLNASFGHFRKKCHVVMLVDNFVLTSHSTLKNSLFCKLTHQH